MLTKSGTNLTKTEIVRKLKTTIISRRDPKNSANVASFN